MKHMATETTAAGNESAFLYRLLVSPAFRWMRYLILVMVLGTISFNQVFIIFMDYRDILGGWIYVFTFIYMLTYIGVTCLNLFWLFPKYLLKRHYMTYLSVLSVAMVIALLKGLTGPGGAQFAVYVFGLACAIAAISSIASTLRLHR